jgi:hypothetical protein
MMAPVALVYRRVVPFAASGVATLRTDITRWPAQMLQRLPVLILGTVLLKKFLQAKPLLKLDR